ncbi:hypothetical protein BKA62DRAFT_770781 [Auriculariales sp. MPI-PUGE-AT-0066]|nr:hypothetical protein BKA62DRAFT_770781 [Auriculariales sp. MPI-PUGE-AT-0066]
MEPSTTDANRYVEGEEADFLRSHAEFERTSRLQPLLTAVDEARSLVQAAQARIVQAQNELAAAVMHLLMLKEQASAVQSDINDILRPLHPLFKIPTDILVLIFERCVAEEAMIGDIEFPKTKFKARLSAERITSQMACPIELAAVCRAWRVAAMCSPRTWSTISVFMEDSFVIPSSEALALALERSGKAPLTINLNRRVGTGSASNQNHLHLLRPLISVMDRCSSLNIALVDLHEQADRDDILTILNAGTPLLESFKIRVDSFFGTYRRWLLHLASSTAFEALWMDFQSLVRWTSSCPNLRHLDFSNHSSTFPANRGYNGKQAVLNHLHDLTIRAADSLDDHNLPSLFDMPNLRVLTLMGGRKSQLYCARYLSAIVKLCSGITRLVMCGKLQDSLSRIMPSITTMSALEELLIVELELDPEGNNVRVFCDGLSPQHDASNYASATAAMVKWPCPRLRTVKAALPIRFGDNADSERLIQFARARLAASGHEVSSPTCLQELTLCTVPSVQQQVDEMVAYTMRHAAVNGH